MSTQFTDTGHVTPKTIEIGTGTYEIMFKRPGHENAVVSVVVQKGQTRYIDVSLIPITAAKKQVTFKSVPKSASVSVERI